MIFACGVRFIRLRSVAVSGWASRSPRAARSMASAVIGRGGLGVLPGVVVLLILLPAYPPLLGKSTTPRCAKRVLGCVVGAFGAALAHLGGELFDLHFDDGGGSEVRCRSGGVIATGGTAEKISRGHGLKHRALLG